MTFKQESRFGSAVATTRRSKGLSQKELAERLHVTQARVCAIERGRSVVTSNAAVELIAGALSCSDLERAALLRAAVYDRLMREVRAEFGNDHQVEMLSIAIEAAQELGEQQSRTVISRLKRLVQPAAEWNRMPFVEEVPIE